MRLLFIRHAEPDYSTDTLTEKGRREAALLAKAAPSMQLDHCFVSPLGLTAGAGAGDSILLYEDSRNDSKDTGLAGGI